MCERRPSGQEDLSESVLEFNRVRARLSGRLLFARSKVGSLESTTIGCVIARRAIDFGEMETRPLFVLGDLVANILVATVAAAASSALIGGEWGMVPGMLAGMAVGMVIALPVMFVLFVPLLGVMEVITPCMVGGMLGGMWGGMWLLEGAELLRWGAATGVVVMGTIYTLNHIKSGPQMSEP